MSLISVVIPVYKSDESLFEICSQIEDLFNSKLSEYKYELIFVNDSPFFKPTCEALDKIESKFLNVKRIELRKNIGQQFAILIGIKETIGDLVVTMDDDLQHPIFEIPRLINAINEDENIDAIFAVPPYSKKRHNLFRNLGSYFISKLDALTLDRPKGLIKSSFRIFKKDLVPFLVENYNASPAMSTLIINATKNIKNITVHHEARKFGVSNYGFIKLVSLTFNNFVYNSPLPLAIIGYVGVFSFLGSLIFVTVTLFRKVFFDINVPGYTTTVTLISFFGGFTLLGLGIIGEYLVRILKEINKPDINLFIKK